MNWDNLLRPDMCSQVVQPINGDPFIGMLETPVTSSPLVANFLSNLPAYRTGVSPLLRGVEVGLAHGLLLTGEFMWEQSAMYESRVLNTQGRDATFIPAAWGLPPCQEELISVEGCAPKNDGVANLLSTTQTLSELSVSCIEQDLSSSLGLCGMCLRLQRYQGCVQQLD